MIEKPWRSRVLRDLKNSRNVGSLGKPCGPIAISKSQNIEWTLDPLPLKLDLIYFIKGPTEIFHMQKNTKNIAPELSYCVKI